MGFRLSQLLAKSELVLFSDSFSVSKAYISHLKSSQVFILFFVSSKMPEPYELTFYKLKILQLRDLHILQNQYVFSSISYAVSKYRSCAQRGLTVKGKRSHYPTRYSVKKGFGTHVFLSEISIVEISVTVENSDEVEKYTPPKSVDLTDFIGVQFAPSQQSTGNYVECPNLTILEPSYLLDRVSSRVLIF